MTYHDGTPESTTGFQAHDWQGKFFLICVYGFAAIWTIVCLVALVPSSTGTRLGVWEAILLLGFVGIHVAIARGVADFRRWGLWAGMLVGVFTLPLGFLFLYYFWTRRVRFQA